MITQELQKKINQSIKLLRLIKTPDNEFIEIAYSGGKDSDVILQLAKEAGIKYRAIYKNTTIDPPFTIKHAKEKGAEILQPAKTFFQLLEQYGTPSRYSRFCCSKLKEYKVLNKAVIGVRREESPNRAKRYKEPTHCRIYKKGVKVEQIFPILDWTKDDIKNYIIDRNIKLHPLYYDKNGEIDVNKRLGCMGCPLQSRKKRLEEFKQYPKLLRCWINAIKKFIQHHPNTKSALFFGNAYNVVFFNLFCDNIEQYKLKTNGIFGEQNTRQLMEHYFNIKL